MDTYAVDYETYFDKACSAKVLGTHGYVSHPDFYPYLVSICGPGVRYSGDPGDAPWDQIAGHAWVSHNAMFDEAVHLSAPMADRYPAAHAARPATWSCTADLAVYHGHGRSLVDAAGAVLGATVNKTIRNNMSGKHFGSLAAGERDAMVDYALKDSDLCLALWDALSPTWPENERRVSRLNRECSRRGVMVDMAHLGSGEDMMLALRDGALADIPWADSGVVLSHNRLKQYCAESDIPYPGGMAEDDPIVEAWEDRYGDDHAVIRALRQWRKSNTVLKKLAAIRARTDKSGRFHPELKYFGAVQTGRFSGDGGVNIQNLGRKPFGGFDMRGVFVASPGKSLAVADFAQIEPRVLAWLARDDRTLSLIRAGYGVYEAFALRAGMWSGEAGTMKRDLPSEYQLCKALVLGLGYGMGAKRFGEENAGNLGGMDPGEAVAMYRGQNPGVVSLWKLLERDMRKAALTGEYSIELPSGRIMRYRDVAENGDRELHCRKSTSRRDTPRKIWGGHLTENATQGAARDVLADAMLRVADAGFDILFTVHDEIVCEVGEGDSAALEKICEIMRAEPDWCPGLPLDVDGALMERYRK